MTDTELLASAFRKVLHVGAAVSWFHPDSERNVDWMGRERDGSNEIFVNSGWVALDADEVGAIRRFYAARASL